MTVLQILQTHYHDALINNQRLGGLPVIEKEQWDNLDTAQVHSLLNWVVAQKWECEQEVIYDWLHGLHSPGLNILMEIVDQGYGLHYSGNASAENKVLIAHACSIGIRTRKLSDEFKSYIVQGATDGDPLLLAIDFHMWLDDVSVADLVLTRIARVDESQLRCSSFETLSYFLINSLEDNQVSDQMYCQWLKSKSDQPWFPKMLDAATGGVWYWENSPYSSLHDKKMVSCLHERCRQFLSVCSHSVIEQTLCEAKNTGSDAKYLDSMIPLLPVDIQQALINDPFFDNQPYTQDLRFKQDLHDSVKEFGCVPSVRKL